MDWILIFQIVVLLIIGFALNYLVKNVIKRRLSEIGVLGLIILPFVVFGFLSGKITEFSGFGVTAKVERAKKLPISTLNIPTDSLKIANVTSNDTDYYRKAYFEMCAEYLVIRDEQIPAEHNERDYYIASISSAIKSSIACGKLAGVVILDGSNRYIGSFDSLFFIESVSIWAVPNSTNPMTAKELASRIKTTTIFGASLTSPNERVSKEGSVIALNVNATVQDAFNVFRSNDVDFIALTDSLGKFQGIVRYRDVVNTILFAAISE